MENERFELQNVAILLSWQLPSFANYKENGQNSRFKKTQNGNIIPRTSPDPLINIANVNQRDKDPGPPIRPYGPQLLHGVLQPLPIKRHLHVKGQQTLRAFVGRAALLAYHCIIFYFIRCVCRSWYMLLSLSAFHHWKPCLLQMEKLIKK